MLRRQRMTRLLGRMFDEEEFLSPHGVRSVSKVHEKQPFAFTWQGQQLELPYWPGESHSRLFGGNSNWRGPVWMPVNFMLIRALRIFSQYYGDTCTLEWPKGSGRQVTLGFLADMLARRLIGLFKADATGQRPAHGTDAIYAKDATFADLVLFYEYYHGETGKGLGASHQTGWSALVALLIDRLGKTPGGNGDTA